MEFPIFGNFARFLVIQLLLVQIPQWNAQTTESEETSDGDIGNDSLDWKSSVCSEFNGSYARRPEFGVTCCKNQTLVLPYAFTEMWETNNQLINCKDAFKDSSNADYATAMWNVTLCIFKNSSEASEKKMTFGNFFDYMTEPYHAEDIVKELKSAMKDCHQADRETDPIKKLKKFTECFHKAEKQVCHKPVKSSVDKKSKKDKLTEKHGCPETTGIVENGAYYCCKRQSLPYNFLGFHQSELFGDESFVDDVTSCLESFTNKHLELDPKLKKEIDKFDSSDEFVESASNPRERVANCDSACSIRPILYKSVKDIIFHHATLLANATQRFGKKVRDDLKAIIVKRKASQKYILQGVSKDKLSYDKLLEKYKSADELTKIKYYCGFSDIIHEEVERALLERIRRRRASQH